MGYTYLPTQSFTLNLAASSNKKFCMNFYYVHPVEFITRFLSCFSFLFAHKWALRSLDNWLIKWSFLQAMVAGKKMIIWGSTIAVIFPKSLYASIACYNCLVYLLYLLLEKNWSLVFSNCHQSIIFCHYEMKCE